MAGKVPMKVLSFQEMSFTDKSTGELRKMWRVYIADDTGAVGSVYHGKPVSIGATVNLGLAVNKEGRFTAKIFD